MISFSQLGNLGRHGNQLFQIAVTMSLALDNNDKYLFPYWKYEKYFGLSGCFSSNIKYASQYKEPYFHHAPITYSPNMDLSGYFQSYKYFEKNHDIISGLLTPLDGFPKMWDTTSIHCRRGDYLNLTKEYAQLQMDYYQAAMNVIKSPKYIIVSDDIAWCKKNFIGQQFTFSEADEITDLKIQIACANNICANSSFSWWGSYLNKNPSKIVVAPKKWFGPALPHDIKDLIPPSWVQI